RSSPGFFDGCAAGPNNVGYWLDGGYDRSRFACIPGHGSNTAGGSRVSTAATAGGRVSVPEAGPPHAARPSREHQEDARVDVANLLMKVSDDLSVRRAFGTAYEKDGMLIIPVAMVAGGGGAGTGRPRQPDLPAGPGSPPKPGPAGPGAPPQDPERIDAGGGFGGLVLPPSAARVKVGQVPWRPPREITPGRLRTR